MATTHCLMITSLRRLSACRGVRLRPSDDEVAPLVSIEAVNYSWHLHHTNDTAFQASAMSKKLILQLNTDHGCYHDKPQLGSIQVSDVVMIWCLPAFELFKAGNLHANKIHHDLYAYWQANNIDTTSWQNKLDDNFYIALPEGSNAFEVFARLNVSITGLNQSS